jgi:hypothetical protein
MMTRLWLTLAALVLLALFLSIGATLGVGAVTQPHPMLLTFEMCQQTVCWLGIDIDRTTLSEAARLLERFDYRPLDAVTYQAPGGLCDVVLGNDGLSETILGIQLFNCVDLELGDLWTVLGRPTLIANDCFNNWVLWYHNAAVFSSNALTPRSSVSQIAFYNRNLLRNAHRVGVPWHGFTPQWRYNQLEGNIRGC